MKILSARTQQVQKWVELKVRYKRKEFEVSVRTENGYITDEQEEKGVLTSYLTYFNEVPKEVRKKHFTQIKKYVERHIK